MNINHSIQQAAAEFSWDQSWSGTCLHHQNLGLSMFSPFSFKTHRVELLSLSLWPGAPVWTCCRSWKNASVTSVPWSSFARGESLRHGSEASNHAVGQAETPFLFLGPLRTFKWELFENILVSWNPSYQVSNGKLTLGQVGPIHQVHPLPQIQVCSLQIWNSMEQAFLPSETLLFNTSLNL